MSASTKTLASTPATTTFSPPALPLLAGQVILLASDGSEPAIAAARMALALATRHGASVRVVNVMDTRGAPLPPPLDSALGLTDAAVGETVHAEQAEAVLASLAAGLGADVQWPVRVTLGTPAQAIAREARRNGAALIITGLRRHGRLERMVDDETTLNLMRHAPCPVLGVVPELTTPPTRVLVAIDFSRASMTAARVAADLCGADARLTLAYVAAITTGMPDDGEALIHSLGVEAGFAQLSESLAARALHVGHVVLHHVEPRPASELLLEYADALRCDLIAAGAARHGRVERWILGSVSTELVRDGRRSVLVVPPPEAKQE